MLRRETFEASRRATSPVTNGAAIDVPLSIPYPPESDTHEKISVPGARKSTSRPEADEPAGLPSRS